MTGPVSGFGGVGNAAQAAAATIRAGVSGRAGLAAYRAGGGAIRDATWFSLVAQQRVVLGESLAETGRPLGRRPTGNEVTTVSSRTKSGYWQQVEVFFRDAATGQVESAPFVLRSKGLLTRKKVIEFALGEWGAGSAGSPNPDEHQVLGAVYVSTLELIPGGV